jgi:predicted nuclease of predicted toxin-antitoxin system
MRFLANENFPLASVIHLRAAGQDVVAVIQETPGARDPEVLHRAAADARVILTFDRDYGELIYRHRLPVPQGLSIFATILSVLKNRQSIFFSCWQLLICCISIPSSSETAFAKAVIEPQRLVEPIGAPATVGVPAL